MEYPHHGDALVPRQQRFGGYTRSLMKGLGVPVENRYGLRPAVVEGTKRHRSLDRDAGPGYARLARRGHHLQLPHAPAPLRADDRGHEVHPRPGQAADRPVQAASVHEAGNREFNAFVWMPPSGARAGDVLVADSTIFSTLFGGDESLERFWKNIASELDGDATGRKRRCRDHD